MIYGTQLTIPHDQFLIIRIIIDKRSSSGASDRGNVSKSIIDLLNTKPQIFFDEFFDLFDSLYDIRDLQENTLSLNHIIDLERNRY